MGALICLIWQTVNAAGRMIRAGRTRPIAGGFAKRFSDWRLKSLFAPLHNLLIYGKNFADQKHIRCNNR